MLRKYRQGNRVNVPARRQQRGEEVIIPCSSLASSAYPDCASSASIAKRFGMAVISLVFFVYLGSPQYQPLPAKMPDGEHQTETLG